MTHPAAIAKALIQQKGVVRSRELVDAGVARSQLSRLVAAGDLVRLARGVYTAPGATLAGVEEGVLVVAEGGDDPRVISDISDTVMALFRVEAHKIKVVKMSSSRE